VNVWYFTDVSLRNCSISKGEDLTLAIELSQVRCLLLGGNFLLEASVTRGRPDSSLASFFTRVWSLTPPQQVKSVFHKTSRSCMGSSALLFEYNSDDEPFLWDNLLQFCHVDLKPN
jgi:hypothetical protein